MKNFAIFLLFTITLKCVAQSDSDVATAVRTTSPLVIDGRLDEPVWDQTLPISSFTQYEPYYGKMPAFQTFVRFAYDDEAIYIAAIMMDLSPDSILMQLGNRDDELNADHIIIQFDPYNNNQDAYYFQVTSSNVQSDWRRLDNSYNAVWLSKTEIHPDSWITEMKIPFAAMKIPNTEIQHWRLQITRNLRRTREISKWTNEPKGVDNEIEYWGLLQGIENIKNPLLLTFTPYLSLLGQPQHEESKIALSPNGGIDFKYGINKGFTLDMTLLPDFSQVNSDNIVKNLSAFEVSYSEQRPFFVETMDIFNTGGLFYSRRIGKKPSGYSSVNNDLNSGDEILLNPSEVKLINAFKISGQTSSGLSMGILNAITDKSEAVLIDSNGTKRTLLTEPFSDYNILVCKQALKYNSSIYIINTAVLRADRYANSNITGSGFRFNSPNSRYMAAGNITTSQKYKQNPKDVQNTSGYSYSLSAGKVTGPLIYSVTHNLKTRNYDINDFGLNYTNDEMINSGSLSYRIFNPFWYFLRATFGISMSNTTRLSSHKPTSNQLSLSGSTTTNEHLSLWFSNSYGLGEVYDYYEPRVSGRYFIVSPHFSGTLGFSSDYRKPFALDGTYSLTNRRAIGNLYQTLRLTPIFRFNNHFSMDYSAMLAFNEHAIGYVTIDSDNFVFFGKRNIQTIENSSSAKYMFRNNLSLSLRVRHYFSSGRYLSFFNLKDNGRIEETEISLTGHDFSFNSFLVDMIFNWEFAPGSSFSFVWKNNLLIEKDIYQNNYFDNLQELFDSPQSNLFALKVLYYLDSNSLKRLKS